MGTIDRTWEQTESDIRLIGRNFHKAVNGGQSGDTNGN